MMGGEVEVADLVDGENRDAGDVLCISEGTRANPKQRVRAQAASEEAKCG